MLLFRLRFLVTIIRVLLRRLNCVFVFRFFITILLLFSETFKWKETIHWIHIEVTYDNDLKSNVPRFSPFFGEPQLFKNYFRDFSNAISTLTD